MKLFVLRIQPTEDSLGYVNDWMAYVSEIENGKEVVQTVLLTGYGRDPLTAVTKLAVRQATVLDGYRQSKSPSKYAKLKDRV